MPLAGAAADLGLVFGFAFTNGFVFDSSPENRGKPALFNRSEGSLQDNPITNGRNASERVEQIATFTGQAFTIPPDASPILGLGEQYLNFLPDTAWVFDETTIQLPVGGWSQGAYKAYGQGKVVAFGEAARFSAQLAGPQERKMGMNHPIAPENYQLLLNIIHWLDGKWE